MTAPNIDLTIHKLRINRYLYTGSQYTEYIAGDPFVHNYFDKERLKSITSFIEAKQYILLVEIIEAAAQNPILPRLEPVIFALAVCAQNDNQNLQAAAYQALPNICKTSSDIFLFVKFYVQLSGHKGFGMGFRKAINRWYLSKDSNELAQIVTLTRGNHGWSHKDLLKMTHPKTNDQIKNAVLLYTIHGLQKCIEKEANNPESQTVVQHFQVIENFKHCENVMKRAQMLVENNLQLEHIPGHYLKSFELWKVLVTRIPFKTLLYKLHRLHAWSFLNPLDTTITETVLDILKSKERINESNIHPADVLIALKDYALSGCRPDFKKLQYQKERDEKKGIKLKPAYTPDKAIINSLYRVLRISFGNIKSTGLRYMICIDAREHMNAGAFKCGNVTALEAAVLITLSIHKNERNALVTIYGNDGLRVVNLDRAITLKDAMVSIGTTNNGHVLFNLPFEWAEKRKKKIDVFINLIHSKRVDNKLFKELKIPTVSVHRCFEQYKHKVKDPKIKLINISLCSHKSDTATGTTGMLDICGFNAYVPKVIDSFVNESFK